MSATLSARRSALGLAVGLGLGLAVGLAGGCRSIPLLDEPPTLVSVNGVSVGGGAHGWQASTHQSVPVDLPAIADGATEVALSLAIDDAEGRAVDAWFPVALGTIDFDPHGTTGRWILPGPDPHGRLPPIGPLRLLLQVADDPSAGSAYDLYFGSGGDSGDTGGGSTAGPASRRAAAGTAARGW